MCNLTAIEQDILKKGVSVGNQVLYDLCQNYSLSIFCKNYESLSRDKKADTANGLAAQLWLIGRAYAASPERRGYKAIKGTKIKYKVSGNGLDDYFDKLADKLIEKLNSEKYSHFAKLLEKLKPCYTLDVSKQDIDNLENSIKAVIELNCLLKESRFELDKDDLEVHISDNNEKYEKEYPDNTKEKAMEHFENNNKNMISFCSKFLHFHFPNTVFIIDGITESHFKGRTEYSFKFNGRTSEINVQKKCEQELIQKLNFDNLSESANKYVKHCVREYLLAKEIKDFCKRNNINDNIFDGKYIPRVIDTYMLIANSNT